MGGWWVAGDVENITISASNLSWSWSLSWAWQKPLQLSWFSQVFWFMPLYLVLNFWIYIFSRCFLNWSLLLYNFSTIKTSISLCWCPLKVKCSPVALLKFLFLTYPRCSENLDWRVLEVSPMYWFLHFFAIYQIN